MMTGLSLTDRKVLVLRAIELIEHAQSEYRHVEADATATPQMRRHAKAYLKTVERGFSWQWKNVKALLQ